MKIKLSIILALLICLVSCDSAESVAESALQKLGDGRYSEPVVGDLKFTRELVEGNEFSMALVENAKAQSFIEGEEISQNLDKAYFQKDQIFDNWRLIEKQETTIDLYELRERYQMRFLYEDNDNEAELDSLMFFNIIELYKDKIKKQTETAVAYIVEKDVPLYFLRYKVDGSSIVKLGVIKHPEHGYKVVSFMWEK